MLTPFISAFALLTFSFEIPLNKSKLIFNLRGEDLMNLMNLFILSVGGAGLYGGRN